MKASETVLKAMLVVVACGAGLSCGSKSAAHEDAGHEEGGHEEASHEGGEHEGEIGLTAEAIERAGIEIGTAQRRALTGGVAIPAEIEFDPTGTAHVGPLASGKFTGVMIAIGDRVRRGQLLGTVASGDASAARSQLQQAQARLAAAHSTLSRQRQLTDEGIGARRSLIEAEAAVEELQAQVAGLRRQLSVFGSGRGAELKLMSPIDGVVVAIHATLGEAASPDRAAFVVTDPDKIWVRGNVPELEIERVAVGAATVVRLHAFPDLVLGGTITYVAPALDHDTRSLPIRVSLDTTDVRLRSGLFGSLELIGGEKDERVVAVPAEAVATLDGQTSVFVPSDEPNTFRAVPVLLGRRAGPLFEVKSGLDEGAKVVTRGAFTIKSALQSGELSEGHAH